MLNKCTKINGANGELLVFTRTGRGGEVSVSGGQPFASFVRCESRVQRWASVLKVANVVYGDRRVGRVAAVNSFEKLHEIVDLIARIAD